MSIVRLIYVTVKSDQAKDAIGLWKNHCAPLMIKEPGCLSEKLLECADAPGEFCVYHTFVVQAEKRNDLVEHLRARGIGTAIHYPVPLHLQPFFQTRATPSLPHAEAACREILSLPLHPELSDEEAGAVGAVLES